MIKIISGKHRNRAIDTSALNGTVTRPTKALVRKSIFDMLGDIEELDVLDLFCGSGIMGIEALSRYARSAVFVDSDRAAVSLLSRNLEKLGIENAEYFAADFRTALKALDKREKQFDLIFCDPPYKRLEITDVLDYINSSSILRNNGRIVLEYASGKEIDHSGYEVLKAKSHSGTGITIIGRRDNAGNIPGNI